jgi:hypothetical protein
MTESESKYYAESIKEDWANFLKKYNYSEVEEDLTVNGKIKRDKKLLGRVAFWKEKGEDGIVISHVKYYCGCFSNCGIEANAIGNAYDYFNKLLKEKLYGKTETIKVNDEEFRSMCVDYSELYNILKK